MVSRHGSTARSKHRTPTLAERVEHQRLRNEMRAYTHRVPLHYDRQAANGAFSATGGQGAGGAAWAQRRPASAGGRWKSVSARLRGAMALTDPGSAIHAETWNVSTSSLSIEGMKTPQGGSTFAFFPESHDRYDKR